MSVAMRTFPVVETAIDGGQYWASSQLQVPGHNPIRFDEKGIGWVVTSYDREARDITALHRESSVRVTDKTRTTSVQTPLD